MSQLPNIQDLRRQHARRNSGNPWWIKAAVIVAALFVVYVIVGFFVVPPIARSQAEKRLSAELHREVRIKAVKMNPLVFSVTVEGLSIAGKQGEPFVSWDRLYVNFEAISFVTGEWRFAEIDLDGLEASVAVAKNGNLSVADLLSQKSPQGGKSQSAARPLRVDRLNVNRARFNYRDDSLAEPFVTQVGPASVALRDFRTNAGPGAPGAFTAVTESGESLGWRGSLSLAPLHSEGDLTLERIVLKKYAPYYSPRVRFEIRDGVLDAATHYEVSVDQNQLALRSSHGKLTLQALKIAAPQSSTLAVALGKIEVDEISADSLKQAVTIPSVTVSGGRIQVKRSAQGIDLASLLMPVSKGGAATAPVAGGRPFSANVDTITVKDLSLGWEDDTTPRLAIAEMTEVALSIKGFSLANLAAQLPVDFSAKVGGSGSLKFSGRVAPQPLHAEGDVQVTELPLALVSPYAEQFINAKISQGSVTAHSKVQADLPAQGAPVLVAQADCSVDGFALVDALGRDFAHWKKVAVRGIDIGTTPGHLNILEIECTEPTVLVDRDPKGVINLMTVAAVPAKTTSAADAAEPDTAAPMAIGIDKVILENADLSFADHSVEPNVGLTVQQLSGTIAGLSSANLARADVDLKGMVDQVAPVSITGQINPLSGDVFTDLKVNAANVDLIPTGPYVAKYAGYQLSRGSLSLAIRVRLSQQKLDSANLVTLNPFELGEESHSPDAPKLPVKFALALLRDTQGRIIVDLPVQGNLRDPSFGYGRVIVRVLTNIMEKAATSPFSVLGAMFGGGHGEDLGFQNFDPGSSTITPESQKKLDIVGKALRERPGLRLTIAGGADPVADEEALRAQELDRRIRVTLWDEQRKIDPSIAAPEQLTVSPQNEARIVALLYQQAFPQTVATPQVSAGPATKALPQPAPDKSAAPKQHWRIFGWLFKEKPATKLAEKSEPAAATISKLPPTPQPALLLADMKQRLLEAVNVDASAYRRLAAERALKVRAYLVAKDEVPPERISLVNPESAAPVKAAKVTMKLE